jgi:hypothetical protein
MRARDEEAEGAFHVLAKVDGSTSAVHKAAINRLWGEWKDERAEHTIFWDYIEEERNSILKTAEFGAQLIEGDDGADIVSRTATAPSASLAVPSTGGGPSSRSSKVSSHDCNPHVIVRYPLSRNS